MAGNTAVSNLDKVPALMELKVVEPDEQERWDSCTARLKVRRMFIQLGTAFRNNSALLIISFV